MKHARFLLVFGAVFFLGCGDDAPKIGLVSGTVYLDGNPLPNAAVSFQPIGADLNPGSGSTGRTNEKGEYSLKVIGGDRKGAVVGKHKVEISCLVDDGKANPEDDRPRPRRDKVPPKYNLNSELTFDVQPGENIADFKELISTEGKPKKP